MYKAFLIPIVPMRTRNDPPLYSPKTLTFRLAYFRLCQFVRYQALFYPCNVRDSLHLLHDLIDLICNPVVTHTKSFLRPVKRLLFFKASFAWGSILMVLILLDLVTSSTPLHMRQIRFFNTIFIKG